MVLSYLGPSFSTLDKSERLCIRELLRTGMSALRPSGTGKMRPGGGFHRLKSGLRL